MRTDRQTFRETVALVAVAAKAKLPQAVNGRVESAAKLVLLHDVTPQADGSILVGSASDPGKTYRLTGQACECQDFTRGQAPDGWCQHRIAAGIAKRVQEQFPQASPAVPPPVPTPPPEAFTTIQGKPFVRFEHLLRLAHERGLMELATTVISVTLELAVCQAVARFRDGRTFTDIGDATPQNVPVKHLAPHFIRLAATRASARALRRALNIRAVAVEELGAEAAD